VELSDAAVAVVAAEAGADVVARDYGRKPARYQKSATDFATQTDLDAEQAIAAVLSRHRPDDARTGEEFGHTGDAEAPRRWLVDPLCGTLNFAATTPLAVVNVALSERGDVRVAAAADPTSKEVFWTDGAGSFLRLHDTDELLIPTASSNLIDINCTGPIDRPFVGGQLVSDPRLRARFSPRVISSSLAVAWVAAGRRAAYVSDGYFRDNLHFAAGIALCEAVGCTISDLAGDPLHTGRGLVIAADPETHNKNLSLVRPYVDVG